jgi:hypothetical protein
LVQSIFTLAASILCYAKGANDLEDKLQD